MCKVYYITAKTILWPKGFTMKRLTLLLLIMAFSSPVFVTDLIKYISTVSGLKVRKGPDTKSEVIGKLECGLKV